MKRLMDEYVVKQKVYIQAHQSVIFQNIREMDGISAEDVNKSLRCENNREMVFKSGQNSGQSGCFFFFSHDKQFIIKTLRSDEIMTFLNTLPDYYRHLSRNRKSVLSRIYGVYTIKMTHLEPVNIVLMQNTMRINNDSKVQFVFDLKGSTFKRFTKVDKFSSSTIVLKDLNFLQKIKQ